MRQVYVSGPGTVIQCRRLPAGAPIQMRMGSRRVRSDTRNRGLDPSSSTGERSASIPASRTNPPRLSAVTVRVPSSRPSAVKVVTRRWVASQACTRPSAPRARAVSIRNSPGPLPSRPAVRTWLPAESYQRSSPVPLLASTTPPSGRSSAACTSSSRSSGAPSTAPMETAGAASSIHAGSGADGSVVAMAIPALSRATNPAPPSAAPHPASARRNKKRPRSRMGIVVIMDVDRARGERGGRGENTGRVNLAGRAVSRDAAAARDHAARGRGAADGCVNDESPARLRRRGSLSFLMIRRAPGQRARTANSAAAHLQMQTPLLQMPPGAPQDRLHCLSVVQASASRGVGDANACAVPNTTAPTIGTT